MPDVSGERANLKTSLANLVNSFTQNVADRLHNPVPRQLDLHYITDRILAMSQCATAAIPTYNDDGRTDPALSASRNRRESSLSSEYQQSVVRNPTIPQLGNSPADVSTFLQKRHDGHALIISLSDSDPDDRSLLLLRRQFVRWTWASPCKERSETPCLSNLLDLCYVMHSYLNAHESNVIVLSCANGKTRSAIAIACYLRFTELVDSTMEGFATFLRSRCPQLDATLASQHIPPSLRQFFYNFDESLELNQVLNPKPLFLRAVALQGVPVDDKPCIDIWDSSQRHVFSSQNTAEDSQWADEEGFYIVNCNLEGDFCLLCRFGGIYANDQNHDPSKVLFRYTNSTGFLSSGTFELPKSKVDMMRRYEASFEEEDFLVTLIFESYWDVPNPAPGLDKDSQELPVILNGHSALEQGWHLLTRYHAVKPREEDYQSLRAIFPEVASCPDHIIHVSLQLTNFDLQSARDLLIHGPMKDWWYSISNEDDFTTSIYIDELNAEQEWASTLQNSMRAVTPEPTCQDILDILDDNSETDSVDESLPHIPQHEYHHHFDENSPTRTRHDCKIQYESIIFPNRGDIVDAFGDYSKDLSKNTPIDRLTHAALQRPRMPMHKRNLTRTRTTRWEGESTEEREAALQLLEQLNHTGINLDDLLRLQSDVKEIMMRGEEEIPPDEEDTPTVYTDAAEEKILTEAEELSENDTKVMKTKSADSEDEDVEGFEIEDENDEGPGGKGRVLGFVVAKGEKTNQDKDRKGGEGGDKDPPLKNDPEYQKYFKMLKMGLPMDAVKHSMKRDGKDPTIMDLDHSKSVKSQLEPSSEEGEEPILKNDPNYEKYFKMLKMGLPMEAVQHSMKRDGKDPTIMDLDPHKSLKSQRGGGGDDGPALKDDPEYQKYFKMLKMGLPMGAVQNALQRDGKDPSIMDLDPEKSLKSQIKKDDEDDGPPLEEDPEYEKYFKMLKMGLPIGAVKNALQRDGKDPTIMDLDPNKSIKSQLSANSKEQEGEDTGPPLKEDPEFEKYFKMLKMGLPIGAVKNAIQRDGKDPGIMDLDPEKTLKSQTGAQEELRDTGVPLKDDPEYSKYFKMLKMGLPLGAVKNAVQRDGKDSSIMDLDQDKSVAFQLAKAKGGGGGANRGVRKKAKKKVRRKKIYWTPIDPEKVVEGSLWEMAKGIVDFRKLSFDHKEFESLFTEDMNPSEKKQKTSDDKKSAKKENVQLIDGKRSMNGGIILSRIKLEYATIAKMVNEMDSGDFDSTQLKALNEFLPTDEERGSLTGYMEKGKGSPEEAKEITSVLPECEKYMIAMLDVKNASKKFDAMLFKVLFDSRLDELVESIEVVKKACNEVRNSERLRKMFAMILTLVNQINTGGDGGNLALGFNLEALLKLGEAKAFDKKTSVLEYLAKLIRRNDEDLLRFKEDLTMVPEAGGVILDALVGDMKVLNEELKVVSETAEVEADSLEEEGKLPVLPSFQDKDKSGDLKEDLPEVSDEQVEETEIEALDCDSEEAAKKVGKANDASEKMEIEGGEKETKTINGTSGEYTKNVEEVDGLSERGEKEDAHKETETLNGDSEESSKNDDKVATTISDKIEDSDLAFDTQDCTNKTGTDKHDLGGENSTKDGECGLEKSMPRTFMEVFTLKARKRVDDVLKDLENIKESYIAVLKYFGEDEKMPSNDFFGILQKFIDEFKAAVEKVDKLEKIKAKEEQKAAKKASAAKLLKENMELAEKEKHADPADITGSIAAIAAATAAKKSESRDRPEVPNMSGIAAMAAAAAAKKNEAQDRPELPNMGGITAMAAAAAAKRKEAQDKPELPNMGGIGAMAAAAAAKKKQAREKPAEPPILGGIAAMVAAAAAEEEEAEKEPEPSIMGGIEVIAAAAAAKKKEAGKESGPRKIGGIAAMVAAAKKKEAEKEPEPPMIEGIASAAKKKEAEKESEPPIMGGIEAIAAAAKKEEAEKESEPPKIRGIAAVAAATNKEAVRESGLPTMGGIDTIAAAAGTKKEEAEKESEIPKIGGIVAMVALAAEKESEPPTMGGIATVVAAAAAKNEEAEPPNIGGIAKDDTDQSQIVTEEEVEAVLKAIMKEQVEPKNNLDGRTEKNQTDTLKSKKQRSKKKKKKKATQAQNLVDNLVNTCALENDIHKDNYESQGISIGGVKEQNQDVNDAEGDDEKIILEPDKGSKQNTTDQIKSNLLDPLNSQTTLIDTEDSDSWTQHGARNEANLMNPRETKFLEPINDLNQVNSVDSTNVQNNSNASNEIEPSKQNDAQNEENSADPLNLQEKSNDTKQPGNPLGSWFGNLTKNLAQKNSNSNANSDDLKKAESSKNAPLGKDSVDTQVPASDFLKQNNRNKKADSSDSDNDEEDLSNTNEIESFDESGGLSEATLVDCDSKEPKVSNQNGAQNKVDTVKIMNDRAESINESATESFQENDDMKEVTSIDTGAEELESLGKDDVQNEENSADPLNSQGSSNGTKQTGNPVESGFFEFDKNGHGEGGDEGGKILPPNDEDPNHQNGFSRFFRSLSSGGKSSTSVG